MMRNHVEKLPVSQKFTFKSVTPQNILFDFTDQSLIHSSWLICRTLLTYSIYNEQSATEHFGFNDTQIIAAKDALQAWANVANLSFNEVPDTSSNVGDFRFAFSSALPLTSWGWAGYPSSYWAIAADVWVNSSYGSEADWSSGTYNYEALMHEIGHGLGLKHPGDYGGASKPFLASSLDSRLYTLMSYTEAPNSIYPSAGYVNGNNVWITYQINPETPMVLDIAAIQYLYGANMSYRTSNDTYNFDPLTPFFKTIWDAGGNDTISASNFTLPSVIDLTPGNYSSLKMPPPSNSGGATTTYDGTNNLGVAFGSVIENAIGGSGNDILIGNSADNNLDGGAGTDSVLFSGNKSNFSIIKNSNGTYSVTDNTGTEGADMLTNIEIVSFADTTWLTDTDDPVISVFSPADASTNTALDSNITAVFSEAVQRGAGSIILKRWTGEIVETFNAETNSNLNISGSTLTINPTFNLSNSIQYFVTFEKGSIKDLAGNAYTGTTTYNFTTAAPSSDRVFNWGEDVFASLFPNHPESQDIFGYHARIYENGNALGEQEGNIYFYDGDSIILVGTVESFLLDAIAAGF